MSEIEPQPIHKKALNAKMLYIAAAILVVLALLFLATPLLRLNRAFAGTGNRTFNGQTFNGGTGGNGFNFNGGTGGTGGTGGNGFNFNGGTGGTGGTGGNGFNFNGGTGSTTRRNFAGRNSLLRLGFLNGITGTIVYAGLLIISLIAAAGMFFTMRWGKIVGILMGIVYLILGLIGLVPTLLTLAFGVRNPLNLILGLVHIVLAIAVIVFASLPAKKEPIAPMIQSTPPAVAS